MALILADRVKETTTVTGTGTATLLGAATGFQSFSVIGNANTTYYCIAGQGTSEWEVGIGTYTASGTTLARTTVLSSSNAGSLVSFSAGIKDVFVTYPSEKSVNYEQSGGVVITETGTVDALRITNTGTGNSFVVEDSVNPDSTPVVIDISGNTIFGNTTLFEINSIQTNAAATTKLQYATTAGARESTFAIGNFATAGGIISSGIVFAKSKSGTIGTQVIVAANDRLGVLDFQGSDGTQFIRSARIEAEVDGTPGTADMPGRLVFSTTSDGASSLTERMRIDSTGAVGIGTTTLGSQFGLRVNKTLSGATNAFTLTLTSTATSTVTSALYGTQTNLNTASNSGVPYTLPFIIHYSANQSALNVDSTVSTQAGYRAENTLIGAANNYGFFGNIANATQRSITTVARTSNVVTITTSVAHGFTAGQQVLIAAVTNTSVNGTFTIASVPTTSTLTYAQAGTDIVSVADTGTVNSAGRFNFYASNTAPNYFNGNVGIGVVPSGTYKLEVTGKTYSSGGFVPRPTSITSAATITPTSDASDQYNVTALATAATIASPSGTPTDSQKLIIRIKDDGTARGLTWTTGSSGSYRAIGVTLPTTTVISKTVYIGCIYNLADLRWDVVSVAQEA